jgi:hypothetical protein
VSWQKVTFVLSLAVIVVLVTLIPVLVLEARRTPDWQSSLAAYLEAQVPLARVQVVWTARAQAADQLAAEMLVAAPTDRMWESVEQLPPPERVRCIRLENEEWKTARQPLDERLIIGYHDDGLYHAGWIVHQFRAQVSQAKREEMFAKIGCNRWVRVSMDKR